MKKAIVVDTEAQLDFIFKRLDEKGYTWANYFGSPVRDDAKKTVTQVNLPVVIYLDGGKQVSRSPLSWLESHEGGYEVMNVPELMRYLNVWTYTTFAVRFSFKVKSLKQWRKVVKMAHGLGFVWYANTHPYNSRLDYREYVFDSRTGADNIINFYKDGTITAHDKVDAEKFKLKKLNKKVEDMFK